MTLPVLDIAGLDGDSGAKRAVVRAIREACLDNGFFYIVEHGIPPATLAEVLALARDLFCLPETEKQKIANAGREGERGYARMTAGEEGIAKEEFYIARSEGPADQNKWPAGMPRFRAVMSRYLDGLHGVAERLMAGLALSLDLPEDHFSAFCTDPIAALRLAHYPVGARGAAPHTDFGGLTLLLQDEIGGLEVLDRTTGGWRAVTPVAGALVVNIGDLVERWTNGLYRSTLHRVVNTRPADRYSAPFFYSGAADHPVACIPSCLAAGERPRFPPTTVARHLRERFDAQAH